jgi:hypothetical protein
MLSACMYHCNYYAELVEWVRAHYPAGCYLVRNIMVCTGGK